jgi:hypothetical protein
MLNQGIIMFKDWIYQAMDTAEKGGERISRVEFDMAIGPMKEAHFFSHILAYGRHFHVISWDLDKKTTMDYGIACVYSDARRVGTEFTSYVEQNIRVFFSSIVNSVMIKGKWWNSVIRQRGPNGTLMVDECRFPWITASPFISDSSVVDELLAFPKDCDQVFYVDDVINPSWKLYMKMNPRSNRSSYWGEQHDGESTKPSNNIGEANLQAGRISSLREGQLVSVVANDDTREDADLGDDSLAWRRPGNLAQMTTTKEC